MALQAIKRKKCAFENILTCSKCKHRKGLEYPNTRTVPLSSLLSLQNCTLDDKNLRFKKNFKIDINYKQIIFTYCLKSNPYFLDITRNVKRKRDTTRTIFRVISWNIEVFSIPNMHVCLTSKFSEGREHGLWQLLCTVYSWQSSLHGMQNK